MTSSTKTSPKKPPVWRWVAFFLVLSVPLFALVLHVLLLALMEEIRKELVVPVFAEVRAARQTTQPHLEGGVATLAKQPLFATRDAKADADPYLHPMLWWEAPDGVSDVTGHGVLALDPTAVVIARTVPLDEPLTSEQQKAIADIDFAWMNRLHDFGTWRPSSLPTAHALVDTIADVPEPYFIFTSWARLRVRNALEQGSTTARKEAVDDIAQLAFLLAHHSSAAFVEEALLLVDNDTYDGVVDFSRIIDQEVLPLATSLPALAMALDGPPGGLEEMPALAALAAHPNLFDVFCRTWEQPWLLRLYRRQLAGDDVNVARPAALQRCARWQTPVDFTKPFAPDEDEDDDDVASQVYGALRWHPAVKGLEADLVVKVVPAPPTEWTSTAK